MSQTNSTSSGLQSKQIALLAGVGLVVVVLGVAGGIKLGVTYSSSESLDIESLRNGTLLDPGDTFPDYEVRPVSGNPPGRISALAGGRPAILIFASGGCSACETMFRHWKKRVVPDLDERVAILVIYDEDEPREGAEELTSTLMPGSVAVTTSRDDQSSEDGIIATPTVVGVDKDFTIKFVMTGYDQRVGAEFLNEQLP